MWNKKTISVLIAFVKFQEVGSSKYHSENQEVAVL